MLAQLTNEVAQILRHLNRAEMLNLKRLSTLVVFAILFGTCTSSFAQTNSSKTELDGKWTAVWIKKGNREAPSSVVEKTRFTFSDGKLVIQGARGDDSLEEEFFTINNSTQPKQIDLSFKDLRKEKVLGIYRIVDDTLELRTIANTDIRPADFESTENQKVMTFKLKRVK